MNIKDFSLNDALSNFNIGKIKDRSPRTNSVGVASGKSKASETVKENTVTTSKRGSVTRERIRIEPENRVVAADGTIYDRTAPKGTYVDIEV